MSLHQTAFARKTVPRAHRQTIVATKNAVADGRAQFDGDGAFQFDGQIGNAAAGIQLERRSNGVGGAGGEAAGAFAAMIFLRRVGFQFQGGDNFRQENPVAEFAADDIGVLADKAQTGELGEVTLQQRAGVHVPQRARFRRAKLIHECSQWFQAFTKHVVVIVKTGVTS